MMTSLLTLYDEGDVALRAPGRVGRDARVGVHVLLQHCRDGERAVAPLRAVNQHPRVALWGEMGQ